jgi:hypothetical protein
MQKDVSVRSSIYFVTLAVKYIYLLCKSYLVCEEQTAVDADIQNSCDDADGASPTTRAVTPLDLYKVRISNFGLGTYLSWLRGFFSSPCQQTNTEIVCRSPLLPSTRFKAYCSLSHHR